MTDKDGGTDEIGPPIMSRVASGQWVVSRTT